jgi:hypothetical protein
MSEIATIISAIALVITAVAGVVAAFSKLGPFVNALNKMLADQHKRAIEAKNKATIQQPASTNVSRSTNFGALGPSRRNLFSSGLVFFSALILLAFSWFHGSPAGSYTVVSCVFAGTTIVLVIMLELAEVMIRSLFSLIESVNAINDRLDQMSKTP